MDAYARGDGLCRAGATTVAELTAFGKPAVLVPYPYTIYDHALECARSKIKERRR
jgi:UDP-N-acetylglucosamine--N-acetylmuramyl-(pentapeptide) pyrophosphoryl-undecaprenol N-acetylglucosamine transferase